MTIDYLLNEDSEEINTMKEASTNDKLRNFLKSKSTRVLYYSLGEFIFFLLLFLATIIKVEFPGLISPQGSYYVSFNTYQIIGSTNYQIGNVFVLLGFLSLFGSLLCGVIYLLNKNIRIHKTKHLFMLLIVVFFIITLCLTISGVLIRFVMLILFSIANEVDYFFFYK